MIRDIQKEMENLGDPRDASFLQRYFKTGPGEYGEGDRFRGIRVPVVRKMAKKHRALPLEQVWLLLKSPYHEDRQLSLFLLVENYRKGDAAIRQLIYHGYLEHTGFINNWDLVDATAEHIVGAYLLDRDKQPLIRLAQSENLFERRIAMLATHHYIKKGLFEDTLRMARLLLNDPEDLLHKAVGWMLREVGNRDMATAESFLRDHYLRMPRTMLRYAVEKYPEAKRKAYLQGKI